MKNNQNPINSTRKNNRIKTAIKRLQKPTRARDNRWNKYDDETFRDVFETYKDHDDRYLDTFRKINY